MNNLTFTPDHTTIPISASFLSLDTQLNQNQLSIEDIGDYIPGSVMVQNLSSMTNTYMNKQGCDFLKHSKEELEQMGAEYFNRFFPLEEMAYLSKELYKFVAGHDYRQVYSFFQRVRPDSNSDYKWYFTSSRLLLPDQSGGLPKLMHVALDVSSLGLAGRKIRKLCEDNSFVIKNYMKFSCLSKREKEIIGLIAKGLSSYEISDVLFISIHTVNNHRKNMLRKLEIGSVAQLVRFAEAFDLGE